MNNDNEQVTGKFKTIPKGKKPPLYCQECNCFTYGKTHTKGHLLIEIVLYLFLFSQGLYIPYGDTQHAKRFVPNAMPPDYCPTHPQEQRKT